MNDLTSYAAKAMVPGAEFKLRKFDVDSGPFGEIIDCKVIEVLKPPHGAVLLAHVGDTSDVSMLVLTSDDYAGGTVVTAIGVCGSDAQLDYGYPEQMVSNEWAGALLMVLD